MDISTAVLPNVVHLTISNIGPNSLQNAAELLSQLTSASRVESITLVINVMKFQYEGISEVLWDRMDEVLGGLQLLSLKSVEVVIENKLGGKEHIMNVLRNRFHRIATRNVLHV